MQKNVCYLDLDALESNTDAAAILISNSYPNEIKFEGAKPLGPLPGTLKDIEIMRHILT